MIYRLNFYDNKVIEKSLWYLDSRTLDEIRNKSRHFPVLFTTNPVSASTTEMCKRIASEVVARAFRGGDSLKNRHTRISYFHSHRTRYMI